MLRRLSTLLVGSDSLGERVWVGGAILVLIIGVYVGIMGLPEQKLGCPIALATGVFMLVIFPILRWFDHP